jgi:hypothetical protein
MGEEVFGRGNYSLKAIQKAILDPIWDFLDRGGTTLYQIKIENYFDSKGLSFFRKFCCLFREKFRFI